MCVDMCLYNVDFVFDVENEEWIENTMGQSISILFKYKNMSN